MTRMEEYIERLRDVQEANRAESQLRREIRLTTGKTPEMMKQYAKRVLLKEHEQLLLEAWQDAAKYAEIVKSQFEEFLESGIKR